MTQHALHSPQQAMAVWTALYEKRIKPETLAGHRLALSIKRETRTDGQNRFFHKLVGEIAKSSIEWQGKKRNAQEWKVLLVSGHAVATKEGAEMIPGLEGEFVNIRESTAQMSIKRGASLIEYTLAFCAHHGVSVPAMEDEAIYGAR